MIDRLLYKTIQISFFVSKRVFYVIFLRFTFEILFLSGSVISRCRDTVVCFAGQILAERQPKRGFLS